MYRKWDKIDCSLVSKYVKAEQLKIKVEELLNNGLSIIDIGNKLNQKTSTIYALVKRNNIKTPSER